MRKSIGFNKDLYIYYYSLWFYQGHLKIGYLDILGFIHKKVTFIKLKFAKFFFVVFQATFASLTYFRLAV